MPVWSAALEIGHPVIDEQHRELCRRILGLREAMLERRTSAEMGALVAYLHRYCLEHFAVEERVMAAYAYPRAEAHQALHAAFVRDLSAYESTFGARGPSARVVLEVKDFLQAYWTEHVEGPDQELGAHLAAAMEAATGRAAR
jgi:hemerythrin